MKRIPALLMSLIARLRVLPIACCCRFDPARKRSFDMAQAGH